MTDDGRVSFGGELRESDIIETNISDCVVGDVEPHDPAATAAAAGGGGGGGGNGVGGGADDAGGASASAPSPDCQTDFSAATAVDGHANRGDSLSPMVSSEIASTTAADATKSDGGGRDGGGGEESAGAVAKVTLPWGGFKERVTSACVDPTAASGQFVMSVLFADLTGQLERKVEAVMMEPLERPVSKSLQRGEDAQFDQLLTALGSVAEYCLPSLLRALFAWYDRQGLDVLSSKPKTSLRSDRSRLESAVAGAAGTAGAIPAIVATAAADRHNWESREDRRDLALEFAFCLVLIEVLRQLHLHPGHEDLVRHLENMAFRHFKYRESATAGPNAVNVNLISDLYAEVVGVLAQARFQSVRARFMHELRELSAKESCQQTAQGIIALLMGMKFFRVKMVPIEEFEASFQFMQELSQYFLDAKDKDIKHALAGLFVEILVPVAACVKNEVNVPCLKSFVEMLYSHTLDMCTKGKHRLAIFPLVTCLLCVSQKQFFLSNWHYFLAMCLSNLKNKDAKMSRVALESLYRLIWVYMIRIKCESNSATQSRLQSIVNSLFPKGSKNVVPRETPLNIFVKIIQFIAQERMDFAMRDIVFDLLSVGRPIKIVTTPERMAIGLRAFLVLADSLQQKEGQPPMPRTVAVLPSGNTLRVKKTFLSSQLTDETARAIGVAAYYTHVRRVFGDILHALDAQLGRPLLMTSTHNVNKEPDDMITGERKPKIDLFRTCVAAIPRLLPDAISRPHLLQMLTRLTVHMDEELRVLSFQSLQNLVLNFADWRHDVLIALISFVTHHVSDTCQPLLDKSLRMLLQLMSTWRTALGTPAAAAAAAAAAVDSGGGGRQRELLDTGGQCGRLEQTGVLRLVEGFILALLCHYRLSTRRLCVHILKEAKLLLRALDCLAAGEEAVIDVVDAACGQALDKCLPLLPSGERTAVLSAAAGVDLQWIAERNSAVWTAGVYDDGARSTSLPYLGGADAWRVCLTVFLEHAHLATRSPCAVAHAWPVLSQRLHNLFATVDPMPACENRGSLLRPTAAMKRPTDQRDSYLSLWCNYALFACRVVPRAASQSPAARCISPETSSAPASLLVVSSDAAGAAGGGGGGGSAVSLGGAAVASGGGAGAEQARGCDASSLHRLLVPLLRCDACPELRAGVTSALGLINQAALPDLLRELVPYIREAVDRKQENWRRRRRRDTLRRQLITLFVLMAEHGVFALCPAMLEADTQSLNSVFVEYITGARLSLELETKDGDKESVAIVHEIKLKFCSFIRQLIRNFSVEARATLLGRELRRSLFHLLASWTGPLGAPLCRKGGVSVAVAAASGQADDCSDQLSELETAAVHACWAVLCCGRLLENSVLPDDNCLYAGLAALLAARSPAVHQLARETLVLLLDFNADVSTLLDWVVDQCYTAPVPVADTCFGAIAAVFGVKDYPCDHYTAIINVTLLNTGCPRAAVHETAFQLLLVLEQRFFGHRLLASDCEGTECPAEPVSSLDQPLAAGFCRSQQFLSRQLAQLHPELTMPLFSEITSRLLSARHDACQLMLLYLPPWLHNMELVDPHMTAAAGAAGSSACSKGHTDAWGSAEATEMVLNNLMYLTTVRGDQHPIAMEQLWSALCSSWSNNLTIILRYLFIVCGMSSGDLLVYGRRVVVYLARARPDQLAQEMIGELSTVESTSYTVERTETPPFFRLTALRKPFTQSTTDVASRLGGDGGGSGDAFGTLGTEKGTIHTKRHSGEQSLCDQPCVADTAGGGGGGGGLSCSTPSSARSRRHYCPPPRHSTVTAAALGLERSASTGTAAGTAATAAAAAIVDNFTLLRVQSETAGASVSPPAAPVDTPQPRPLPMPEYGGFFAPLCRYLPASSQPHGSYHRCNLALLLVQDALLDGAESCAPLWCGHLPLLLHISMLALDHSRALVVEAGRRVLLALLTVVARHAGHTVVARAALSNRIELLEYGISVAPPLTRRLSLSGGEASEQQERSAETEGQQQQDSSAKDGSVQRQCLALIDYLTSRPPSQPLWSHEDVTARDWRLGSVQRLSRLLELLVRVFCDSVPRQRVRERWAQLALHIALSCSSRHLAGRSLQIFRALCVPVSGTMLSDILSRLVETVCEQGDDMQGYVTEIMITLEAAVDCIDSQFRPIDFVNELFKSTPNLIVKEPRRRPLVTGSVGPTCGSHLAGHLRASGRRRERVTECGAVEQSVAIDQEQQEQEGRQGEQHSPPSAVGAISRSHSTSNLKGVHMAGQPDFEQTKLSVLTQLFWLSVSLLESDYEYEFLLAMRLLDKVLGKLSLERRDCRDRLEKMLQQLRWPAYPGLHALLLKGCTNPATYDLALALISQLTPLLRTPVVDPSLSLGLPMNVIALLPHLVCHYEEANQFCVRSAENIAQACLEHDARLENLATVMTLYSRRTFSRESIQWTKCVIKYLTDAYPEIGPTVMVFLVDMLEKGPACLQLPILNVLNCLLHYMESDVESTVRLVNTDLLQSMARCVQQQGPHWREALRILKLTVTQSSTLVLAPSPRQHSSSNSCGSSSITGRPLPPRESRLHVSFTNETTLEPSLSFKKELPGRTMEFTFDVSRLPIIGRRVTSPALNDVASSSSASCSDDDDRTEVADVAEAGDSGARARNRWSAAAAPSAAECTSASSCWKRPWLSQSRTRDRLVCLLMSGGTRVGLPKSPSVIFSQNSDLMERQSSVTSSTEEMSVVGGGGGGGGGTVNASAESLDDHEAQQFSVIRVFDFLEYELASQDDESLDNFNWGVRRHTLSEAGADALAATVAFSADPTAPPPPSLPPQLPPDIVPSPDRLPFESDATAAATVPVSADAAASAEDWSDDDVVIGSPLDELTVTGEPAGVSSNDQHRSQRQQQQEDDGATGRSRLSISSDSSSVASSDAAVAAAALLHQSVAAAAAPDYSEERTHSPIDSVAATVLELSTSPSLLSTAGIGSRHSSDLEEQWFRQLALLTDQEPLSAVGESDSLKQPASDESAVASAYMLLWRLLADILRAFVLTVDECVQLMPPSPPPLAETAAAFCHQLHVSAQTLRSFQLPHVFVNAAALRALDAAAPLRFTLLEMHEHVLTYQERRDVVARGLDTGRCTLVLDDTTTDAEAAAGPLVDQWCLQLMHALRKLHFQLLLLLQGQRRTLTLLASGGGGGGSSDAVLDLSDEVSALRHQLCQCAAACPGHDAATSSDTSHHQHITAASAETSLTRLLAERRCGEALQLFRQVRHLLSTEWLSEGDDVDSLLTVYCWVRSEEDARPLLALSGGDQLARVCRTLQQANVTLVTQLGHIDRVSRSQPRRYRQVLSDGHMALHSADC